MTVGFGSMARSHGIGGDARSVVPKASNVGVGSEAIGSMAI